MIDHDAVSEFPCAECGQPFTVDEWDARHTRPTDDADVHAGCCAYCVATSVGRYGIVWATSRGAEIARTGIVYSTANAALRVAATALTAGFHDVTAAIEYRSDALAGAVESAWLYGHETTDKPIAVLTLRPDLYPRPLSYPPSIMRESHV